MLDTQIGHSLDLAQHPSDLIPLRSKSIQIVPEQFDRQLRAHPGHQFIHAHRNRLRQSERNAGDLPQSMTDLLDAAIGALVKAGAATVEQGQIRNRD